MTPTRWWQRGDAIALTMLLTTVPLWFVDLPPLIDLLGHIGRYHIQLNLADNAVLQRHWDYRWLLIGNLGGDLAMAVLGRVFGVVRGATMLAALLPPLMIWGMVRLARAAHGTVPATTWAAFPLAMAYPWQYGLVNYWLGIAVALHAAACAIGWRTRHHAWAMLIALSLGLWVIHIFAWGVFAVLVVGHQFATQPVRTWPRGARSLWPLAAPAVLMIGLGYGREGSAAATPGWFDFGYKAKALLWTLRDQWQWLDLASLGAALTLIVAGVALKAFQVDRGLMLAAALLLGALVVIPYQLVGSAYADARLWPVVIIVALLALRPSEAAPRALPYAIAVAAALVLVVRVAATTTGFQTYDRDFARHLLALDAVPRGSRVAVFVAFPCDVAWRRPRYEHLDGVVIVRRDAFTNGQWDVPGAQTLIPLGARGTRYNADPSQLVMGCGDLRERLAARIAGVPHSRFDFVWVLGWPPGTLPRWAGLTPVFADEATILYRLSR